MYYGLRNAALIVAHHKGYRRVYNAHFTCFRHLEQEHEEEEEEEEEEEAAH